MAVALRLARGGSKKRPYYRIVATDSRSPRDSKFIEKLGVYNPLLAKDNDQRFTINEERLKFWLETGAKPSEAVARFLRAKGLYNVKPTFQPKAKGTGSKKKGGGEEAAA